MWDHPVNNKSLFGEAVKNVKLSSSFDFPSGTGILPVNTKDGFISLAQENKTQKRDLIK